MAQSLPTKAEVVAKLDGLNYQQRAAYAAGVGRSKNATVKQLIKDMQKVHRLQTI